MKSLKSLMMAGILAAGLGGCGSDNQTSTAGDGAEKTTKDAPMLKFVSTKDGSPLPIKPTDKDTPEVKEFYKTGKNPYTKKFISDPEAAKTGRKVFNMYSCTQCHGGNAGGQTGPSLTDDNWVYPKNVTDKGMFETISGGTNAGMPIWHLQVAGNPELLSSDDILRVMAWIRSMYAGADQTKEWLK